MALKIPQLSFVCKDGLTGKASGWSTDQDSCGSCGSEPRVNARDDIDLGITFQDELGANCDLSNVSSATLVIKEKRSSSTALVSKVLSAGDAGFDALATEQHLLYELTPQDTNHATADKTSTKRWVTLSLMISDGVNSHTVTKYAGYFNFCETGNNMSSTLSPALDPNAIQTMINAALSSVSTVTVTRLEVCIPIPAGQEFLVVDLANLAALGSNISGQSQILGGAVTSLTAIGALTFSDLQDWGIKKIDLSAVEELARSEEVITSNTNWTLSTIGSPSVGTSHQLRLRFYKVS